RSGADVYDGWDCSSAARLGLRARARQSGFHASALARLLRVAKDATAGQARGLRQRLRRGLCLFVTDGAICPTRVSFARRGGHGGRRFREVARARRRSESVDVADMFARMEEVARI